MSLYTVQVKPPFTIGVIRKRRSSGIAESQAEALTIVEQGYCKGMPAKIVPPLCFPCRADL